MKYIFIPVAILLSAVATNGYAQSKDAEKYKKQSEDIRRQVWAWDKAQFKVTDIPAQYANASQVVIAHHTELTAATKSRFTLLGIGSVYKDLQLTEVVREMVKLNDKTAVDEYSQLSFTQFVRQSGFSHPDKATSYLGARIIKPGGKVEEINADDIVLTQDESSEKKAKVAIPDLEPGDILDYFLATEQTLKDDQPAQSYQVILFSDAPVLNLSFHAQLAKKYAIQYRSYNGAPDLQVSKNDDNDIIADVLKTNIPPFETSLWVSAARQLPFIRMNISLGSKGSDLFNDTQRPGVISKNTDIEHFIEGEAVELSAATYGNSEDRTKVKEYDRLESEAKRMARQCKVNYKDLSDEDKAAWLFYTLRFTRLLNFDIDHLSNTINIGNYNFNHVAFPIYYALKSADLNPAVLISADRTGFQLSEILSKDDLLLTAFLPASNKILCIRSVFDLPYMIPADIEGLKDTRSYTFRRASLKKSYNLDAGPAIPMSTSDMNAHIENLKLSLLPGLNGFAVRRSTTIKGLYKASVQKDLILYEDFYEEERKAFNEDKSLIESLDDGRKSRKSVDEVKNAFAEARKKQKDNFVDEAKDWFEQDVTDLRDYKTDTLGVRHTAPNFVYSSSFNLNGMVKKAGNNIIVEIGKIEGGPLILKPKQRKRDIDIYMPYARSLEYNIEFEIPDGYTVEGIAALNKKVSNEAGYFTAEASASGKIVTIKIKKHYLHDFEPAKNWVKIIEFTDAAAEWAGSKFLLKKG